MEEAYWSGTHAFLPYMQHAYRRSDPVTENAVRANRLEALTLEARAVQQMLKLNPAKALRLFGQSSPVPLPKLTGSTAVTPDPIDYYQSAALVFKDSFTAEQRKERQDLALLRQVVTSVESPAQVPPALEMIFAVKLAPTQRRELLSALATRLDEIFRLDREYGAAEAALVLAMEPGTLAPSGAAALVSALRTYIVRHVGRRRCTDNPPAQGVLAKSAQQFNRLVAALDPEESRYKRISADESKSAGDDGTYPRNLTEQSARSQAVVEALRWLTHGDRVRNGKVVRWTLQERSDERWLRQYNDAARLVHDLKESDESSPEAFFCAKADALNILATLAPPGEMRDEAMQEYREFLEDYYASIENPNLRFTIFRHMLYTASFSDEPKERAWILEQLGRSPNPVIALDAKFETRVGPPGETYPPMHVQAAHR